MEARPYLNALVNSTYFGSKNIHASPQPKEEEV
jgi:hypothetical protein